MTGFPAQIRLASDAMERAQTLQRAIERATERCTRITAAAGSPSCESQALIFLDEVRDFLACAMADEISSAPSEVLPYIESLCRRMGLLNESESFPWDRQG